MTLKKDDIFQAFFAAGLEGDYNFLEDDLLKLAKAFAGLRDNAVLIKKKGGYFKFHLPSEK